ncbi:MAG: TcpQ domain-containing protein, partial [Burkholderiaceae bacterium]|nr:TcpQ domain-containing protein [Burkholderiaceae bacterium]
AGWRVLWQGAPAVAITGDSSLQRPDFLQAADYVINQAKGAGYRIRGTAYSNQTLVISGE